MSATTNNTAKPGQKMVGTLFAGVFLLAGLVMMYLIALKPVHSYLLSIHWLPVHVTVTHSELHRQRGDNSSNYRVSVRYHYQLDGQRYQGDRLGFYQGSDNLGRYWQDQAGRLQQARQQGRTVTAWVNPANPSQAYLDRTVRPQPVMFGMLFGGVFVGLGGGLLWLLWRRPKADQEEQGMIACGGGLTHKILLGIGAVLLVLSSPALIWLPGALLRSEYTALAVALFPLLAVSLLAVGWRVRHRYRFFGPTPLRPDPNPGQAGGQVGGEILLNRDVTDSQVQLTVMLSCVRGETRGSGKDRRVHETILWQREQRPYLDRHGQPSRLRFCFEVPGEQPSSQGDNGDYVRWRVNLQGLLAEKPLRRQWLLPVSRGGGQSGRPLPRDHRQQIQREQALAALSSASEQVQVAQTMAGLRLYSAAGRHWRLKLGYMLFGAIFAAVGAFLFVEAASGGLGLYFMAAVFLLIGSVMVSVTAYGLGRSLEAVVQGGQVRVLRRWLGIPLYRRQGEVQRADQLQLTSAMSSTQNGRKTDYYCLQLKTDTGTLRLAEAVAGEQAAEALRDTLLRALGLHLNH